MPQPQRTPRDEQAGTEVIGFLVALSVVSVGIGTVLLVSYEQDTAFQEAKQSELAAQSERLADLILNEPGNGWYSGTPCASGLPNQAAFDPEAVTRFGLASEPCMPGQSTLGNLSYEKLLAIRKATHAANGTNGYVDYEEARDYLGLDDEGLDFHLRSSVINFTLKARLDSGSKDTQLRVAYVGDYEPSTGSVTITHSTGITDDGSGPELWAEITNDGVTATVFEVAYTLYLKEATLLLSQHTPVVLPATTVNVSLALPESNSWAFQDPSIDYIISDPVQVLGSGSIDTSTVDLTSVASANIYSVSADRLYYLTTIGSDPKVHYDVYDTSGNPVAPTGLVLEVYDDALGLLVAQDLSLHSRGWESFVLPLAGTYTVQLKDALGAVLAQDTLVNLDIPPDAFSESGSSDLVPQAPVPIEGALLEALSSSFDNGVYDSSYAHASVPYVVGGDIYPDAKAALDNDLTAQLIDDKGTAVPVDDTATLVNYNVLVIGSNVEHDALTSDATKDAIRDWVELGGAIIVLGSVDGNLLWLQPLFDSASDVGSGAITVPDPTHPLLHTPNDLDWASWTNGNRTWSYTGSIQDQFTAVIQQGGEDVLSISKTGAFGDGTVILSAYQLYNLLAGAEPPVCGVGTLAATCPALAFLDNGLSGIKAANVSLDYGPPLPSDEPFGSTTRIVSVYTPEAGVVVPLRVTVYVF